MKKNSNLQRCEFSEKSFPRRVTFKNKVRAFLGARYRPTIAKK